MKQLERQNAILRQLQTQGAVSIQSLSEQLGTSVVTIRKDLLSLEERKLLRRVTGGAVVYQEKEDTALPAVLSSTIHLELKQQVAHEAAKLIRSGDSLVVTSGATPHLTLYYASANCSNLKILTDSILVAEDFCRNQDYQVLILGGELDVEHHFVHGRDAVRQVSNYMADKAIVTIDGIDPDAGLSAILMEGADTNKTILSRARERILVADITKIGLECFCHIGDLSLIDILVTNHTEDAEKLQILARIEAAGVRVIMAPAVTAENEY